MENIDIGGPAMIRAAAKNHEHVTVVVDPSDYGTLLEQLQGGASAAEALAFRKQLAWKAFQHCATYDSTVAEWLWTQVGAWALAADANRHRQAPPLPHPAAARPQARAPPPRSRCR